MRKEEWNAFVGKLFVLVSRVQFYSLTQEIYNAAGAMVPQLRRFTTQRTALWIVLRSTSLLDFLEANVIDISGVLTDYDQQAQ